MSAPSSMDNMVDNLQSKDSLTYVDVCSPLIKPSGAANLSSNGKALDAPSPEVNKFPNKQKNFKKHNPTRPVTTERPTVNQYSYSKKHNQPDERHIHKFYV